MNGREQIEYERRRQISEEGWSIDHDDTLGNGALLAASTHYLVHGLLGFRPLEPRWPPSASEWKPKTPVRDLVRAGALALAEAERQDRQAMRAEGINTARTRALFARTLVDGIAAAIDRLEQE